MTHVISVVIPALNEAGNIGRLVEETFAAVPAETLGEVIVIDDGSDDATPDELAALIPTHPKLRVIGHAKRCGQSTGLRSGIRAARFGVIATMDGDGQNDPADIPRLLTALAPPGSEGPALVNGVRAKRKAVGSRRIASTLANKLRDAVLRDNCPDTGCGIKVYWREAFLALPYFTSMHRYLPFFFQTYGHQVVYMDVNDRDRQAGQSKYTNFGRAMVGIYDLIGVTWLRRRTKVPVIAYERDGGASAPATATASVSAPTPATATATGPLEVQE